ncbi:MAG TPA: 4Fe-4S dicluster domain-containing protein [Desulfobacteraceae bacterium]|nr:4Fe-4S dicluster domain-containing protein [Desulfobacteraceae bacterium]
MALITIDQTKCNRDGICAAECPGRIIEMDAKSGYPQPAADFEEICLKCGHCVTVCPTGALSLDWLGPDACRAIRKDWGVTPDQAEQLLCGRRSIRNYKEKRVPRPVLKKLVEIACSAPSAKNQQPWHWIVVEDPSEVRRLAGMVVEWVREVIRSTPKEAEAMGLLRVVASWDEGYDRICRGAPHVILAHADKNWAFSTEDCTLAMSHLDLYAAGMGLGTCWAGYFFKAVNAYPPLFEALGLPSHHLAYGAMMIGYPKFKYRLIPRRRPPRITWK